MNPLISVLIVCYNSEKYIAQSIESVLASSYTNFELIINDDCSTDNTVAIAKTYELKDKRVKVYGNAVNLSDYANRNKAASYASGEYLKYLDSDDTIYKWGLEVMVMCMEKYPVAAYGVMSAGNSLQPTAYPILVSPKDAYYGYFFKGALLTMGPTGAIIRKTAFDKIGGFSGKPFIGDQELWLKLSQFNSLVRMPLDLIWWRQHEGQESKREKLNDKTDIKRFYLAKEALEHIDCPLNITESTIALRNLYNIKIRGIFINNILRFKFKKAAQQCRNYNFNFIDIAKAIKKNKLP